MYGWEVFLRDGEMFYIMEKFKEEVIRFEGIGVLYGLFCVDLWFKMNKDMGVSWKNVGKVVNKI